MLAWTVLGLILFSMNSLLLANFQANLTKNHKEARKPVSLHSGVAKYILLYSVFGFCNPDFNNRALLAFSYHLIAHEYDFY